jgi:hypothetical protein
MAETLDQVLAHYGVKGMRWGVRKAETERQQSFRDAANKNRKGPQQVDVKASPGKRVKTSGGKGYSPSDDAVKTAVSRQKAKKSTVESLSNDELQAAVRRMQLEQQFVQLSGSRKTGPLSAGKSFVKELLGMGKTANEVIAFQNSPAGKQLSEQLKKVS